MKWLTLTKCPYEQHHRGQNLLRSRALRQRTGRAHPSAHPAPCPCKAPRKEQGCLLHCVWIRHSRIYTDLICCVQMLLMPRCPTRTVQPFLNSALPCLLYVFSCVRICLISPSNRLLLCSQMPWRCNIILRLLSLPLRTLYPTSNIANIIVSFFF